MSDKELPIAMPSFCWNNLSYPPENIWFSNFQQFHDDFGLLDRPFRQCIIVMDLISDDL
jgi:hypothetical protein